VRVNPSGACFKLCPMCAAACQHPSPPCSGCPGPGCSDSGAPPQTQPTQGPAAVPGSAAVSAFDPPPTAGPAVVVSAGGGGTAEPTAGPSVVVEAAPGRHRGARLCAPCPMPLTSSWPMWVRVGAVGGWVGCLLPSASCSCRAPVLWQMSLTWAFPTSAASISFGSLGDLDSFTRPAPRTSGGEVQEAVSLAQLLCLGGVCGSGGCSGGDAVSKHRSDSDDVDLSSSSEDDSGNDAVRPQSYLRCESRSMRHPPASRGARHAGMSLSPSLWLA